ncbi:DUF2971 domain-containing protein [Aeromonas sp. 43P]|uniref:DUF2971 domain-containing protein n=1 Tax=Aeromonas sp. 43P TaxID=3115854 RepID=UPI002E7B2F00|nr:DUF2971 domain-containing protein [Aeromonas sp. 43P]MEE1952233.1 DUF2971 domain-containing protein [Aeromonas sp. 43P]
MKTYYKYSKYFGIESLKYPVIRLSSPAILNDPFEKLFNSEVENNLIARAGACYKGYFPMHTLDEKQKELFIKYQVKQSVNNFGIVSLSETHSNLLMWSHYADEHKGICLGFHENFLSRLSHKIHDEYGISTYKPIKVNYNNKRPRYFIEQNNIENEIKINTLQQLTTKGDDWIYEKEHRCIVPLRWADEIKLLNIEKLSNLERQVLEASKDDLDVVDGNRFIFKRSHTAEQSRYACLGFTKNADAVLLKRLSPKSIKSIHMGCKMSLKDKISIAKVLSNPANKLHHIELYEYVESTERYELVEKKIYP